MLGGIDQNWVYKIVIALLKQDGQSLIALTQQIASFAPSYSRLFAELIQLFHQIAILQIVDQHFDLPVEHAQLLKKFSQAMSAEDVQLYYQICVNGRKDLPYASDEQAAFDMTLLRLFAFKPMHKEQEQNVENNLSSQQSGKAIFEEAIFEEDSFTLPSNIEEQQASELAITREALHEESSEQAQVLDQQMQALEQQAVALQESENEQPELHEPVQNTSHTVKDESSAEKTAAESPFDSPVSAVLATRNMLRSRKKQLDKQAKKPSDAIERQINSTEINLPDNNVAEVENKNIALPQPAQAYQAESIDPVTIRNANQVDQWAHMIDSMELTARLRQLAIHATIDENSTEDNLILRLDQATKHLYTETAQQQLQQSISQFLSRSIEVTINIVEKTVADPYKIQSHINDKRYDYAKELLHSDAIVQGLVQTFQATLDDESISAV